MTLVEKIIMEGKVAFSHSRRVEIDVGNDHYVLSFQWVTRRSPPHDQGRMVYDMVLQAYKRDPLTRQNVVQPDIIKKALLILAWPTMSEDDDELG